jgi:hypothetical protein
MLLACHEKADQNRDIKIGHRAFENVPQFKYRGKRVTIENLIQWEIKRRFWQCLLPFSPEPFVFSYAV